MKKAVLIVKVKNAISIVVHDFKLSTFIRMNQLNQVTEKKAVLIALQDFKFNYYMK